MNRDPNRFHPSLRTCALALGALVAIGSGAAPVAAQPFDPDAFDAYLRQAFDDWNAVGLAVAVVKDGELLFAKGYGETELGSGHMVDEETRFSIGSTTKAMTAAAIGMLVDEGKVAWDDPVTKHLPWFELSDPWVTREITLRDLLTHRAGLGNTDFLWYGHEATREWVVEQVRFADLAYSPRSSFIYQNVMYATAGLVVEAVSGVPWAEFIRTRIFEPLGMTESFALLSETEGQPSVARPHHIVDGETVVIENASVDAVDAAGSVWSSVEDMSRWLRMLLAEGVTPDGTRVLSEEVVEEMFTPQTLVHPGQFYPTRQATKPNWTSYGLGWFQHDFRGRKLDFHTGSIDGLVAIAGLVRDEEVGVYVLGNRDHVEVRHAIMYQALDHFLAPEDVRDWSAELKTIYDGAAEGAAAARARREESRVAGTAPSHELSAYAGEYRHEMYGSIEVRLRDGGLYAIRGPGLRGPASHWHHDTFLVTWEARWRGDALATFETDAGGRVAAVNLNGLRWERVPEGQGDGR
jgi:CubicO group peptidase (beta-lactamase class C family)